MSKKPNNSNENTDDKQTCPDCQGTGWNPVVDEKCEICQGEGKVWH